MKVLFLDVDGVLHRLNGQTFERLQVLVDWLRKHSEVHLVLSSSTREYGGMARLSAALPADVRPQLLSQTPLFRHEPGSRPYKYIRQAEILKWLETNEVPVVSYAALDDDPGLFEPGWPPLVLCDPSIALKTKNLRSVEKILKTHESDAGDSFLGLARHPGASADSLVESKTLTVSDSKQPIAKLSTSLKFSDVVSLLRTDELGSTELPVSQLIGEIRT